METQAFRSSGTVRSDDVQARSDYVQARSDYVSALSQALSTTRSLALSMRDVVAGQAVRGIDLSVHHGDAVALVGADRSTVVRLITGDLQSKRGTISRPADGTGCHMISLVGRPVDELALGDIAATRPNLILVDEPFATLSKREADEMLTALLDCCGHRTAVVIATDRADVIERCTSVVHIDLAVPDRA